MLCHNAFFFKIYCVELNQRLKGFTLTHCLSNSKNELYLLFENKLGDIEKVRFQFVNGKILSQIKIADHIGSLKGQIQFEPIIGRDVLEISHNGKDRSFNIKFKSYTLIIKAYGGFSNLILFNKKGEFSSSFIARHKKDLNLKLSDFLSIKNIPEILTGKSVLELKQQYPFLPKSIIDYLKENEYDYKNEGEKINMLNLCMDRLKSSEFYFNETENNLSYINSNSSKLFNSAIDAQNLFFKNYISSFYFDLNKKTLLNGLQSQLKKNTNSLIKIEQRLDNIENQTSNKDKADLLMANLWQIKKGDPEVILNDFYTQKPVIIKLNTKLNAQENAEKYYKKSKSEHKEINILKQRLIKLVDENEKCNTQLTTIQNAVTHEDLRPFVKKKSKEEKEIKPVLPYILFNIDGYSIWVGKNAKSNDSIIKMVNKNDLWFHARQIAGSHVILRNKNKNIIPNNVIEKAASLAAYYSKAKGQTMVPVIKTYLKFVRKPKNALPGQVLVEKEEVLLVDPKKDF